MVMEQAVDKITVEGGKVRYRRIMVYDPTAYYPMSTVPRTSCNDGSVWWLTAHVTWRIV